MGDTSELDGGLSKSSPWPVFVAIGLALSEVGVVLAILPLAVGGLLLFVGSIAGILAESGHVGSPWPLLAGLGGVLFVLGTGVYLYTSAPLSVAVVIETLEVGRTIAYRGVSIVTAALLTVAVAIGGWLASGSTGLEI
ncbi:MAG: hypothetical protein ACI9PP_000356 [Halobacteriales archaeon]|jgi:hypothetical protein